MSVADASEISGREFVIGTWGRRATATQQCRKVGNLKGEPDDPSLVAPRLLGADG